ncbi:MAG TPA: hypothetical protein PLD55_14190 [bacterium]|jgi:hypothetical protein|nr:hypothetical protein [bacterium]HNZ53003.1 hypothetical protein [bacterium]HOG42826.1 hypothetical protein [bacterium]HPY13951.1 hypothetical protein [bacterium]HQB10454.1 hypothetical protein [bacterium]
MKKIVFLVVLLMASSFLYASYYIGAKSESSWENGWSDNWRGDDVCGNWYNTMDDYSGIVKKSWTTLRSPAKSRYETNGDQDTTYGLDGMDIFLHCGHSGLRGVGGVTNARWNMWEDGTGDGTWAFSSNMRLGDEARELKLFSTYGCYQMNNDDGGRWSVRWRQIFRGGLKYATGFHEFAWLFGTDYAKNRQVGKDYANYLNTTNKKIKYAWWDAVKTHANNTPAVGSTGSYASHAESRRDNMIMPQLITFSTLRDNSVGGYAWTEWR